METGTPSMRRGFVVVAAFGAIYAVVAKLALALDAVSGFATVVWPPTGIALSIVLLFGPRLSPGIWVGAFLVNLWAGAPWFIAAGIATGNTLEALVGAYAFRRLTRYEGSFDRLRHVIGLLPVAFGSTIISATIGVLSLRWENIVEPDDVWRTWRAWWVGDTLGDLVILPLILTWATGEVPAMNSRRRLNAAAICVAIIAVSAAIFFRPHAPSTYIVGSAYALFPLFMWAAIAFELHGATTAAFLASAFAVWGTVLRLGPFVHPRLADSLFDLQTFMGSAVLTPLVVGGAIADRSRALRAREAFLATVSHDLRSPLSAIQMSAQSLVRAFPDTSPGRVEKHDELVQRNTARMTRLIQDLLDASAIDAGRLSVDRRGQSAATLLKDVIDAMAPLAAAKAQVLSLSDGEDLRLLCDRDRVIQVLTNLVANAIKFSPEHASIQLRVCRAKKGFAQLSVADNGPGIDPGLLRHLFERHWHTGAAEGGGSGLGLFVSKAIVDAHGGRIWVESSVGAGSTFLFTLPMAEE
jgi:signal transduction histidine kinase